MRGAPPDHHPIANDAIKSSMIQSAIFNPVMIRSSIFNPLF
jgi:hypothetical protein